MDFDLINFVRRSQEQRGVCKNSKVQFALLSSRPPGTQVYDAYEKKSTIENKTNEIHWNA